MDNKDTLQEDLGRLQEEQRFITNLRDSEDIKYFMGLVTADAQDAKRIALAAPTEFLYLRAQLAHDALAALSDIVSRRTKHLDLLIQSKKQQFQQSYK